MSIIPSAILAVSILEPNRTCLRLTWSEY